MGEGVYRIARATAGLGSHSASRAEIFVPSTSLRAGSRPAGENAGHRNDKAVRAEPAQKFPTGSGILCDL